MSNSFLDGLSTFFEVQRDSNSSDIESCRSGINHYKFYQFSLIPAAVLTIMMAATKTRRAKLMAVLDGRPGLIFPMDTLTRSSTISYACAFGATGFLVYQILLEQKFAIDYAGPIALKTLIAVISMFVYGMVFFPVFACLALRSAFSYGLGSLYVWMFFVVEIYRLTECNYNTRGRAIIVVRALPSLGCLSYLSVSIPVRFFISLYHRRYFVADLGEDPFKETMEDIKESYQGRHVTKLLKKPVIEQQPEGLVNTVKTMVMGLIHQWIYHREPGFRYPSRLISVMFVGACVVYVITVEFLVSFTSLLDVVMDNIGLMIDEVEWDEQPGEDEGITTYRNGLLVAYYFTYIAKVSTIVSIALSCTLSMLTILNMLSSYRTNLFAMYRGDYKDIPSPSEKSAVSLCVGSIKYAGFQVAYIVWAYVICCLILFIVCMILAAVIVLLLNGVTDWLVNKVLQVWPSLLIAIATALIQMLLAKFVFLQKGGEHLRLNNRRFYFVFTYFMFFFNIFLGLVSCLLRILKAIVVGTLFLARLDNSTLPRKFEFFDPGFSAYQGYIHMENAHTHPVVNVFIRLLVCLSNSSKSKGNGDIGIEMPEGGKNNGAFSQFSLSKKEDSIDGQKNRPVNLAARFQWHVTYTLLNNPQVRMYRKGYFQAIKIARKEGIKVPISDKPVTDFDLVKCLEERKQEKEEEAKRAYNQKHQSNDTLQAGLSAMSYQFLVTDKSTLKKKDDENNKHNSPKNSYKLLEKQYFSVEATCEENDNEFSEFPEKDEDKIKVADPVDVCLQGNLNNESSKEHTTKI